MTGVEFAEEAPGCPLLDTEEAKSGNLGDWGELMRVVKETEAAGVGGGFAGEFGVWPRALLDLDPRPSNTFLRWSLSD
jgi:hypothetical protein